MNVTRDVITDLWPLYAAGEASADTRALVEQFLQHDPEFARQLQESGVDPLRGDAPCLPPDREARALRKTKRQLHGWDVFGFWLFNMALLFSCLSFGRIIADTSWDVSPRNFIITASIAVAFWIAVLVRPFWVRWKVYRATIGGR
jgi:hypothetical protein